MKILVTGATGLIGKKLLIDLQKKGHTVAGVARDKKQLIEIPEDLGYSWDALTEEKFPVEALQGCEVIIHLAGYPIADKRWNEKVKKKILDSRVRGTRQLVAALAQIKKEDRPHTLISASAVGFYGDRGAEPLDESSSRGNDFLSDVVVQWEEEALKAKDLGLRTLLIRSGVVLSRSGGALEKMPAVKIGSGDNYMSWIHLQDWADFISHVLDDQKHEGIFNLVAPNAVQQSVFVRVLAQAKKIPFVLWAPKFMIQTILGQMSEMLLASQKVDPQRTLKTGFKFKFENIEDALKDIYQDEDYLTQDFRMAQFVPEKIEEVFQFFSRAENLEKLTPPFLNFRIEKASTPQVQKNTIIDYKLKIHGVPTRWKTEIIDWIPLRRFVDLQRKGPYSLWHHTHEFYPLKNGTLIQDRIKYKVPGHLAGLLATGSFIKNDVRKIFNYRSQIIQSEFK